MNPSYTHSHRVQGILVRLGVCVVLCGIAAGTVQAYTSSTRSRGQDDAPIRPGEGFPIGPFVFSPSVSMNLSYDDNVFSVDEETCRKFERQDTNGDGTFESRPCKVGGSLMTARGRLALKLPFSHSYSSLTWAPQYREYGQYKAPLRFSHNVTFETRLNFASGSTIEVRDEYNHGYQEGRRIDSSGEIQFSSTKFVRNHPQIRYDWSIAGAWGFMGKVEQIDVAYDQTDVIDFSDFVGGSGDDRSGIFESFDYVVSSVEAGGYRDFSRVRVYAAVVGGLTVQDRRNYNRSLQDDCRAKRDFDPDGTFDQRCPLGSPSEQIDERGVDVGIVGQVFPSTTADVRVGWDSWRFTEPGIPDFSSLSVAASIEHRFNRRMTSYLDLKRAPLQATGQVIGYYVREDVRLGVERSLTMKTSARVGLTANRYSYAGSQDGSSAPFTFTDYRGELEVRYRLGQAARPGPLLLTLLYNPVRRASSLKGLPYESQRLTLSLLYGWF